MNAELKDYIASCEICSEIGRTQQKEIHIQRPVPDRAWAEVGIDICYIDKKAYLVTVDYYSNFSELGYFEKENAEEVINKLKNQFSRLGIPDVVYSDNGPQFDNEKFRDFANKWSFSHITSLPRFPSSNGKVEEAIQTLKRLILKSKMAKSDPYLALLGFRNTPTQGIDSSPAQRLFNRRTKTPLPMTTELLK